MTLMELLQLIRNKIWLVILLVVLFAAGGAAYAYGYLQDEYSTTVRLYVLAANEKSDTVNTSDFTVSNQLASDIGELIKSKSVKSAIASDLHIDNIDDYTITVASTTSNTNSRIINITITGKDPQMVAKIGEKVADKADEQGRSIMNVQAVNVVDKAEVPDAPSGPNRLRIVGIAALAGLVVALAIIVLMDMLNTTVGRREDIEQTFNLPVLGTMPDLKKGKR